MKKELAFVALLALSLMACSGDDSPAASEQLVSGTSEIQEENASREVKMSFRGCYENLSKKVSLLKEGSDDLPLAYLYHENDKYQVMIPKISDYCTFLDVKLDVNRFGDTLSVEVKSIIPSKCVCVSDHWFDIEAKDADIKYFKFKNDVYEVVPGPAPEG